MLAMTMVLLAMTPAYTLADVSYGDFAGSTVIYRGVTEAATTGDPEPLYGQPTITGNTLDFDPTGDFSAFVPQGSVIGDTTDGKLSFTIEAKPGNFITSVSISEFGDYAILAAPSSFTATSISGTLFVTVGDTVLTQGFVVNPTPPYVGSSPSTPWFATAVIDLTGLDATSVDVVLNNTLQAVTDSPGSTASITKKDVQVSVTTVIPEPGTLVLASLGISLILVPRRRRG